MATSGRKVAVGDGSPQSRNSPGSPRAVTQLMAVLGPAVVHTGSVEHVCEMIRDGWDSSPVMHEKYGEVEQACTLCDMCFMTKCPYVPPHPWNVDFPHLMLRAKHLQHRKGEHGFRDRLLSNTRGLGSIAGIPLCCQQRTAPWTRLEHGVQQRGLLRFRL